MRPFPGRGILLNLRRYLEYWVALGRAPFRSCDISFFHEFSPPPDGGGHQFLRALKREMGERGWRMENNTISAQTQVCLFNSFNFDAARLRFLKRNGCRLVHRVDGPICTYRGFDDGTDQRICALNHEFADASILQSNYSLKKHQELGFELKNPQIITNAADPLLFNTLGRSSFDANRKIRLVSTSWSDNRNKGADVYQWLDEHLDFERYEYVFIGRLPIATRNIRVEPPAVTERVAALLKSSDVYITASKHDPCSNSLIEAMTCGLPAIGLNSGGHPELIGEGGECFDDATEIPHLLDAVVAHYTIYQSKIMVPKLKNVTNAYLDVMGMSSALNIYTKEK